MGHIHIQWVDLLDGGQLCGITLANQCTFGHQSAANSARDGGCHAGVAQVDVGIGDGSLACCNLCQSSLLIGDRRIVFLLADGVGFYQRLVATCCGRGLGQIGFGLRQSCLCTLQIGAIRRVVDLEKGLSSLDIRALLEQALLHNTCSACAYLGNARWLQATRQV